MTTQTKAETSALLPCPFCGGTVTLNHLPQEGSWSECWRIEHRCRVVMMLSCDTAAEAIAVWNTRTQIPAQEGAGCGQEGLPCEGCPDCNQTEDTKGPGAAAGSETAAPSESNSMLAPLLARLDALEKWAEEMREYCNIRHWPRTDAPRLEKSK